MCARVEIVKPIHIFIHSIIYKLMEQNAKWVLLILFRSKPWNEIVNIQHKNAVSTWNYFILIFFIFRTQHYRIQSLSSVSYAKPKPCIQQKK